MTILQEIHAWSKGLSAWQQDAIARLYVNRELSAEAAADLYALAKSEAGIEDPEKRAPKALSDAQVVAPSDPDRLVKLLAIKDLANVNALASGGALPIAENGLTVIYGENGAGKSGYSRILKNACRARDQREVILPNAKLDRANTGTPSAKFDVSIDGEKSELTWTYGSTPSESLSEIAIFDTYCARAYIDNHGDFAYRPYGLDILEGLVGLCGKLKALATQEKSVNTPTNAAYSAIATNQTSVGRALLAIPGSTKAADIESLATLSKSEFARLELLTKILSETDPKQKAQALKQRAGRLQELKGRIDLAMSPIGSTKIETLRELIDKSKTAKAAADLAAAAFTAQDGQLPGTGGEEWKALFDSARVFVSISHPEHQISHLPNEASCPLCQNVLGSEGAARISRFEAFIQQASETHAKKARSEAEAAYRTLQSANLDLLIGAALREELREIDASLPDQCAALETSLITRKRQVMEASAGKLAWEQIQSIIDDPRSRLEAHAASLIEQATALEASADEKAKAILKQEKLELDARMRLAEVKVAVLDTIAKHQLCAKLQACIDAMDTRAISRKSTELSQTMASQELADALNAELRSLKVHELYAGMRPESPGGKTQFKLMLQLPGGGKPSAILSEGEQRAIAIAAFLAEIRLGKGKGGIVFDDPVSSLDHRRRWEVADRLAQEAKIRQVIIFTHDIYFLAILEQKAEDVGVSLAKNYIRRTFNGFGVYSQSLPFDVEGTKARVAQLQKMQVDVQRAKRDGDDDQHRMLTVEAYGKLRLAWERCVEEVLFNGVVQRFGEGVSTQKLKAVVVTDDDYKKIEFGMSKSSKFEHDAASPVGRLPLPDPEELLEDIRKLEAFRLAVVERNLAQHKKRGASTMA